MHKATVALLASAAALAVTGVAAPAAHSAVAQPVSHLTLDAGCSTTVLARGQAVRPTGPNRFFVSGTVTGVTPLELYSYDWPAPGIVDGATTADLGIADGAGVVVTPGVELQPKTDPVTTTFDYEVRQGRADPFGNPSGPVVLTGTQTLAVRPAAACRSLGTLATPAAGHASLVLVQQTDGNDVLRLYPAAGAPRVLWSSGTAGHMYAGTAMQADGNLVIRDIGRPIWSSGTAGHPGATLTLQADHNLVIRDVQGRAIWSIGVRP